MQEGPGGVPLQYNIGQQSGMKRVRHVKQQRQGMYYHSRQLKQNNGGLHYLMTYIEQEAPARSMCGKCLRILAHQIRKHGQLIRVTKHCTLRL